MGQELTTNYLRIKRFLGLNNRITSTALDYREASGLQNVNITEHSLEQRGGSTDYVGTQFLDKTDSTAKNLTGLYQTILNNVEYRVAVGGDAFKQKTGSGWTDRTGSITITDDDDFHWDFSTFIDDSGIEVIVGSNGYNDPFKWTGTGNATGLLKTPGNFLFSVVHKNRLWVSVEDILYFSDYRNCESWDLSNDLIRYDHLGEDISGLAIYNDQIVVFQKTQISMVSGSSNRDLFSRTVVTNDGCAGGFTIQAVESKRYGNILVFLSSKDGRLKGFNGTPNLIDIGYPASGLFDQMNKGRMPQAVSVNNIQLGQYWIAMSYASNSENNQIIIYDYQNDYFTDKETGRALSSILYHTGIKANAMSVFNSGSDSNILLTANYNGNVYLQGHGLLDEDSTAVSSNWTSGRIDFGSPSTIKMLTDLNVVTTQSSTTNMTINIASQSTAGIATLQIDPIGSLWGVMLWGTGLWSSPVTIYTRAEVIRDPNTEEGAIIGRYLQFSINHSTASESMKVEELLAGVTSLGDQQEYLEA